LSKEELIDRVTLSGEKILDQPVLFVYSPRRGEPVLAWRYVVGASLTKTHRVIVSAESAAELARYSLVYTENVAGLGTDLRGVTRLLNVWHENEQYYLVDTSKPMFDPSSDPPSFGTTRGAIIVEDAEHRGEHDPVESTPIPSSSYITSSSATDWSSRDGVSAAWNLSNSYDYFLVGHARNSFDGAKVTVFAWVRYGGNFLISFKNAFWNPWWKRMAFGDGFPGSTDIVAHEFTHAVTQFEVGGDGFIYQEQSGAISEAYSDIFGELVEKWTTSGMNWSILDRNLRDPNATMAFDGRPYPARMSEFRTCGDGALSCDTEEGDYGGVHTNCTIVSHAFYLLSDGLSDPIGSARAAQIFFGALGNLTADATFIELRQRCVEVAKAIYGPVSTEAARTGEAFDAVEIFDEPTVELAVGPDAGAPPLIVDVAISATNLAVNTTSNFSIWWDCGEPTTSVQEAFERCGNCWGSQIGYKVDATTSSGLNVTHTYSQPGTYSVKVILENGSFSAESRRQITVGVSDSAAFLGENYPDGSQLNPRTEFTKTWGIKNSGLTTWTSGYRLRHVSGSLAVDRSDRFIQSPVPPGASYWLSVPMQAPASPGVYEDHWQFVDPVGRSVPVDGSQTIWARIVVPAAGANPPSGYLDFLDCDRGYGWAWDPDLPNEPVSIEVREGATSLMTISAGLFRPDLFQFGTGYHAFEFVTPATLKNNASHTIRLFATSQGQTVELTNSPRSLTCGPQSGCQLSTSSTYQDVGQEGGNRSFSVYTGSACPWEVSSDSPWITVQAAGLKIGGQELRYGAAANTGGSLRLGSVTVKDSDQTIVFAVSQAANSACSYSLSPTQGNFGNGNSQSSFTVNAVSGCLWTANTTDWWVTIQSGASGIGAQQVTFSLAPNWSTSPRYGSIIIRGTNSTLAYSITQAGQPAVYPDIDLPVSSATLSDTAVGSTVYQTFVIRNLGQGYLQIGSVDQTGSSRFSVYSWTRMILAGQEGTLTVAFTPASLDVENATFAIASNDPDEPSMSVQLSGQGSPTMTEGTDFSWRDVASIPEAMGRSAATVVGNWIYVFGATTRLTNYRFDPTANRWESIADSPLGQDEGSAITLNGKAYVITGFCPPDQAFRIQEYDPTTNEWSLGTQLPEERRGGAMVVANGKIYWIGGWSPESARVDEYDPATGLWTRKQDMPTARGFSVAGYLGGKIYVAGGMNDNGPCLHVEAYDPNADTWATGYAVLSNSARLRSGFVLNDKLYAVGGLDNTQQVVNEVWEFDPAKSRYPWEIGTWIPRNPIGHARNFCTAEVLNGKVYVIGGSNDSGILPQVEEGSLTAAPNAACGVRTGLFGDIELGQAGEVRFAISNQGNAALLLSYGPMSGSSDFMVFSGPARIEAGQTGVIRCRFVPTAEGESTAEFQLSTDDPDQPVIVFNLMGRGTAYSLGTTRWTLLDPIPFAGGGGRWLGVHDNRAYVTHTVGAALELLVFDLNTLQLIDQIPYSGYGEGPIVFWQDKAYCVVRDSHQIAVFDLISNSLLKEVAIGIDPIGIACFGDFIYIGHSVRWANGDPASITILDARTDQIVGSIPVPAVQDIDIHQNQGKAFVTHVDLPSISIVDLLSNTVTGSISLREAGRTIKVIGGYAFVAEETGIEIVDVFSTRPVSYIPLMCSGVWSIAEAGGSVLALAHMYQGPQLVVIDPRTLRITQMLSVADGAFKIAGQPDGKLAVFTSQTYASLGIVRLETPGVVLSCQPSSLRTIAGGIASTNCELAPHDGFIGDVTLSIAGLPSTITCAAPESPRHITNDQPITFSLAFQADGGLAPGLYAARLSADTGSISQTLPLGLTIASCDYSLQPGAMTVSAVAASTSARVLATGGCGWSAASDSAWLALDPNADSNMDDDEIRFSISANPSRFSRTGGVNVTHGSGSSASLSIQQEGNRPPMANAGADAEVAEGTLVRLDGSQSNDFEGFTLGYRWQQISGPAVTLTGPTSAHPSFAAPILGGSVIAPLVFELTVSDELGDGQADNISFSVRPHSFSDVDTGHLFYRYIEAIYARGITAGCGSEQFCADMAVTRAQMAVFLEKAIRGSDFSPTPAIGIFGDVPPGHWAGGWIEQLAADGITAGCGGGNFCPDLAVTRAQMAVFLLKAKYGSTYTPPAQTGVFNDVPIGHWAGPWIERLAAEGITAGCSSTTYCPDNPVTRGQMAVFLTKAFGL